MKLSVIACALGALGSLGGGWLIGRWCFGLVLILLGAGLVAYGLLRDDGSAAVPQVASLSQPKSLADVLERARRSS